MASIPVWIGGRERLVSGITKRTTFRDVIDSLLQYLLENDDDVCSAHVGTASDYGICEGWNNCERSLPAKSKVYKVWKAWGRERENVKFVVKKRGQKVQLADGQENMRRRRRSSSSSSNGNGNCRRRSLSPPGHQLESGRDRREGFGEEEKAERACHQSENLVVERLESMVQLVISQDNHLLELAERIRITDQQISKYETKIHLERLREDGKDYVQNSYLNTYLDSEHFADTTRVPLNHSGSDCDDTQLIDSYLDTYESVLEMEEAVEGQRESEAKLYRQVCEESYMLMAARNSLLDQQTGVEDDLRRQLEGSVQLEDSIQQEASLLEFQLQSSELELQEKKRELERVRLLTEQIEIQEEDSDNARLSKDFSDQPTDNDSGCGSSQGDDRLSPSSIFAETVV